MAGHQRLNSGVAANKSMVLILIWIISGVWSYQRMVGSQCIPIKEALCRGNYNYTSMPNILGHENHDEASGRLHEFGPLIENTCSDHVKFFLCSLHFPMCDPKIPFGIPACKEMCDDVREKCEPYLKAFHLDWPETIQCHKLPPASSRRCLGPPTINGDTRQRDERNTGRARPVPNPDMDMAIYEDSYDDVSAGRDVISDDETMILRPGEHRHRQNRRLNKRKKNKKGKINKQPKLDPPQPASKDNSQAEKEREDVPDPPMEEKQLTTAPTAQVPTPATPEMETESKEPDTSAPNNHRWSPINVAKDPIYSDTDDDGGSDDYFSNYGGNFNQFVPSDESEGRQETSQCKNSDKFYFVQSVKKCLPICDPEIDVMFSSRDKTFAYYWMMACSILCVISSALTVGTFLVDSKRFRYPERPIIFLSLCYLLYSSAYLVRLGSGHEGSVSCVTKDDNEVQHLVMGDLESTGCTAVFFLLYYFGMAAAVWWVILSVTWFLAAGLKWGHEAIEANGFCFHLAAWLLPAIQTIVVLVLGKVDGDELTGLCYVGNLDRDSLLYFIIIPLSTYLAVGTLALGCGFLSLLKIRRVMRKTGDDPVRLEKLILKIGVFTVLYIVPTACVVAVNVYQYNNAILWMQKAEARPCYPAGYRSDSTADSYNRYDRDASNFNAYYDDRPQSYQNYDYDVPYMQQSPYYRNFGYQRYEGRHYAIPDTYNSGYNQRYSNTRRYLYDDNVGYQENESVGPHDAANREAYTRRRPVYNGRYPTNVRSSSSYDYRGRHYRSKNSPMAYDPKIARSLQAYRDEIDRRRENLGDDGSESESDCHLADSIPSFPIFAIKIFMSLLAGITSGIWVWSGKTYKSWKIFCKSSWCGNGEKEKGSDATANTPHETSSGNLIGPPSVTSQLLPKANIGPSPEGDQPSGNRYSFPISDRYPGYQHVKQDDGGCDVTRHASTRTDLGRKANALTLGDIAREYSDNLELERNGTCITSPLQCDDASRDVINGHKGYNMNQKPLKSIKKARNARSRDFSSTYNSRSIRAIPNLYEDSPSRGRIHRKNNRDLDGSYHYQAPRTYGANRVRKYSEGDVNRLNLVSESGFSPISMSTRRKAESAHVGYTHRIQTSYNP